MLPALRGDWSSSFPAARVIEPERRGIRMRSRKVPKISDGRSELFFFTGRLLGGWAGLTTGPAPGDHSRKKFPENINQQKKAPGLARGFFALAARSDHGQHVHAFGDATPPSTAE
jgi:hypothetical protein